ncbi:oxidoreductase [Arthrobacter sp. YC-RL1]|uniref:flavin reductase family protein n=1 Tax=Arthrobacter sp. YC-RL1 TaxID=1652545 RepID=UPI00063D9E36|nr:iron-sulfur cluster-binding domain-containing protein [Arthrobacter sp. YC-RL1]ALQ29373.1 oxidoreductase [Arthrobacter sp. YC-RL1]KLI89237.1 oxidoreductase [Arthrobacter sp. YC-RL1]
MTVTTTSIQAAAIQRIGGLEMPWNAVLRSSEQGSGAARALNPWHPQEFTAECVQTIPEAGGMKTFVFRRTDGAPLAFRAGQYLNFAFPVNGDGEDPVDRSYSISSAPTAPWTFSITVKRDPKGQVSPWVHENVQPSTVLDVLGPVGAFHLPDIERRARFLFLAAGAGITPIMSMVRTIHALPGKADVVVLYHGAEPGGFGFSTELEYLAAVDERLKVYYSLGERSVPGDWGWMHGRLTAQMLEQVAPDANGRQVYACGPEGYLNHAADLLRQVGVDDTSIHMEFFSGDRKTLLEYEQEVAFAGELAVEYSEELQENSEEFFEQQPVELGIYEPALDENGQLIEDAASAPDSAGIGAERRPIAVPPDASSFESVGEGTLNMAFLKTGLNVRISPGEQILDVARRAGVRIGANCQEGMCGSCKIVKVTGEVTMNHQGGIRAREISAGKFLPCCSTADTDLVIDH